MFGSDERFMNKVALDHRSDRDFVFARTVKGFARDFIANAWQKIRMNKTGDL